MKSTAKVSLREWPQKRRSGWAKISAQEQEISAHSSGIFVHPFSLRVCAGTSRMKALSVRIAILVKSRGTAFILLIPDHRLVDDHSSSRIFDAWILPILIGSLANR
jgi:hypothetical protein